jgi:hypothetical protein
MSYNKGNGGIQTLRTKLVKFGHADFVAATAAVFINMLDLPPDAILTRGFMCITEVFNSTSSDSIVIGDATTANRYLGATSIQSLGVTALVPTGTMADTLIKQKVGVTWTPGSSVPTTGEGYIFAEYHVPGVEDEYFKLP